MLTEYKVLNENAMDKIPYSERVIYVLMTNHPDYPSRPYYVGLTSDGKSRFSRHREIAWHMLKLAHPANIWIAGHLPKKKAHEAEQNLIKRLSEAGYLLTNNDIRDTTAREFQKRSSLSDMSPESVLTYLNTDKPGTSVMDAWLSHWRDDLRIPSALPDAAVSAYSKLFIDGSGNDVRHHPAYKFFPSDTSPNELCDFLLDQDFGIYDAAGEQFASKYLAIHLIRLFDATKGYADPGATLLSQKTGMSKRTVCRMIERISHTGLWATRPGTGTMATQFFPLFIEGAAETYLYMEEYS